MIIKINLEINTESSDIDADIYLEPYKEPTKVDINKLDIEKVAAIINRVFIEHGQQIKELARVKAEELETTKQRNKETN